MRLSPFPRGKGLGVRFPLQSPRCLRRRWLAARSLRVLGLAFHEPITSAVAVTPQLEFYHFVVDAQSHRGILDRRLGLYLPPLTTLAESPCSAHRLGASFDAIASLQPQIDARGLALILDPAGVQLRRDYEHPARIDLFAAQVGTHRVRARVRKIFQVLISDGGVGE